MASAINPTKQVAIDPQFFAIIPMNANVVIRMATSNARWRLVNGDDGPKTVTMVRYPIPSLKHVNLL